jgi:hypothetical protein
MSLSIAPSIQAFLESEAALRARHGARSLYVRPTAYAVPRTPGAAIVIGGWAFFDGDPAILPEGLHLLVITDEGPDGKPRQLGREPAAILALLAPFAMRLTSPCPHVAVRVPLEELARIRARVAELPEHDPLAAAGRRELFPVLKEADWQHRDLVVSLPFPGLTRADAPIVTFAEDTPDGYVFLTREDAPDADARALLDPAIANLQRRPTDYLMASPSIAVSAGRDLSAERILDREFLGALHEKLGPELWVCVPHRAALYAIRASAGPSEVEMFAQIVEHDAGRAPELGHAPVSRLAFQVVGGVVVDAVPLATLTASGATARAGGLASGIPHPAEVVRVDAEARQINAVIIVAGSGAKRFARTIFAATGGIESGPPIDAQIEHYAMRMGDIRGWQTRLLFYAGDDTIGCVEAAARSAPHAAALVLVQGGDGAESPLEPGIAALARAERGADTVVAFVGPAAAAAAWARAAGAAASIVAPLEDRTTMDTLKKIAKSVLANLRSL